jgi:hypothetical protein
VLHKCANPTCSNLFRRLSQGKLFQVEAEYLPGSSQPAQFARKSRPLRKVEYYWLCDQCSSFLTLTFEKGRGMITVPLLFTGRKPAATVHLDGTRPGMAHSVTASSTDQ